MPALNECAPVTYDSDVMNTCDWSGCWAAPVPDPLADGAAVVVVDASVRAGRVGRAGHLAVRRPPASADEEPQTIFLDRTGCAVVVVVQLIELRGNRERPIDQRLIDVLTLQLLAGEQADEFTAQFVPA